MHSLPCVYIIDDDEAVRDSIGTLLEGADITFQTFETAEQFLDSYIPGTPGCVILDVNLPGLKGPELQDELKRRDCNLPIIFLTAFGDIPLTVRAMKAGAIDFLTKPAPSRILIQKIQETLKLEEKLQDQKNSRLEFKFHLDRLTKREKQILPMALKGMSSKQIAKQLNLNYRTVENYRIQILNKTETNSFLELADQCAIHQIKVDFDN